MTCHFFLFSAGPAEDTSGFFSVPVHPFSPMLPGAAAAAASAVVTAPPHPGAAAATAASASPPRPGTATAAAATAASAPPPRPGAAASASPPRPGAAAATAASASPPRPGAAAATAASAPPPRPGAAAATAASAPPPRPGAAASALPPRPGAAAATAASAPSPRPGAAASASPLRPGAAASASPLRPGAAASASPLRPGAAASASPSRPGAAASASPLRPGAAASASPLRPGAAALASPPRPRAAALASPSRPRAAASAPSTPVSYKRGRPRKRTASLSYQPTKRPAEHWHDLSEEDVSPVRIPFCPKRTPGPQLDPHSSYRPLELFQLFFTPQVVKTLCANTNEHVARLRAAGRKKVWKDVTPDELYNWMAMVLYLGLVKVSEIRDLWNKESVFSFPFPPKVMAGHRFEAISASLHMSDPDVTARNDRLRGQPEYDQLCRLKPVLNDILDACRAYYHPYQNLAVDERMVKTKASIGMKQYMRDKPTKWGYKLFVLADSKNGFTCNFSIYEGKAKSPSGKGLSFDAVVNLLEGNHLGSGYHIYVDNFYTSTMLFSHLHHRKFGVCGTVRERRIGFPQTQANALPKSAVRGDMRWIREGPLLYVKWKDTRDVTMCSTIHKAYRGETTKRRIRKDGVWTAQAIPVPSAVKQYNKYMGGVDLSDALIKYYTVDRKTNRWYMKLFLHLIDISVVNSFILYKEMAEAKGEKPMKQKRFRIILLEQLGSVGKVEASASREAAVVPGEASREAAVVATVSLPEKQCLPVPVCPLSSDPAQKATQGRRKCVRCQRCTIYKCEKCDVPLCIVADRICFTLWHKDPDSREH
ncbi:hypothetical protein ACEWY4_016254 [Coilia grayii]|uniref:PiggyBac transposable element-derived protein domain-containing protein n=1 Tax=Coilia grayii TaxID=363190 RepID=A0ABD1JMJ1_9TELE